MSNVYAECTLGMVHAQMHSARHASITFIEAKVKSPLKESVVVEAHGGAGKGQVSSDCSRGREKVIHNEETTYSMEDQKKRQRMREKAQQRDEQSGKNWRKKLEKHWQPKN